MTHEQLHLADFPGHWESQSQPLIHRFCHDQAGTDMGTPGFDGSENQLNVGAASPAAGALAWSCPPGAYFPSAV